MPPELLRQATDLVDRFMREPVFWRQFALAEQIADRGDRTVLIPLAPGLHDIDRHARANVAFIFARLGDPRGLQTLTDMLSDYTDRPEAQGIAIASSDGRYRVERQIASDRYYAAHVLGELRDPKAVPFLVPLLDDRDVWTAVPWALGRIGDSRAIAPLLDALDREDPTGRVLAINALATLHATEAIPRLTALLADHRRATFGRGVSVAEAAQDALARLQ